MKSVPIDPATNLPALPTGWFWRVSEVAYTSTWVEVQAVRRVLKRKWWGGRTLVEEVMGETPVRYNDYKINPVSRLKELACYVYINKLDFDGKIRAQRSAEKAAVDATLGDYPPKRLS